MRVEAAAVSPSVETAPGQPRRVASANGLMRLEWASIKVWAHALSADARVLCLAAWLLLALGLQRNNGHYTAFALYLVVLGFGLFAFAAHRRLQQPVPQLISAALFNRLLAATLIVVLLVGTTRRPGGHVVLPGFSATYSIMLCALAAAAFAAAFGRPQWRRWTGIVFVGGCIAAAALRIAMPFVSPAPVIDVFVMLQESSRNFLAGLNPYTVLVSDVYGGMRNFGYDPHFAYAYMPTSLYPEALSYWLFLDVRFVHIAAELAAAVLLFLQARRRLNEDAAKWVTLIFLFHPRGLYVIENAWTEPLLICAYAICNDLAARYPRSKRLAIAYGVFVSMKLYLVYFALHALLLERRLSRLAISALVALGMVLPFLIADPEAFIRWGIAFQLNTTFRPDALSLLAGLHHFGIPVAVTKLPTLLIGGGFALYTLWRFFPLQHEGWRWATALTTWALFLAGSQAFCNYYYFVGAMVLFTLVGSREHVPPSASPQAACAGAPQGTPGMSRVDFGSPPAG